MISELLVILILNSISPDIHPTSIVAIADSALLSIISSVPLYLYIIRPYISTQASREAQIEAACKMASLGEITAGIAHEINNPLTIIAGKSELLHNMIKKQNIDYEKAAQHLLIIQNMNIRISKIVKGLRSFSRNEEDEPYQRVNLFQIMADTIDLCHSKFLKNNIKFMYSDFSQELFKEVYINCHPTQISQVLINILSNAADAIANFETRWIEIKTEFENEYVFLRIIDSGKGIPKDIQHKLFNPFFTTKEAGKGTGLGLSISRNIITNHQGELYIDNDYPNTCFVIKLPFIRGKHKLT